jgi:hypothetical protein
MEPILVAHVLPYDYHPELKFRATIYIPDPWGKLSPLDLIGGIDIATRFEPPGVSTEFGRFRNYDLKATTNTSYIQQTLGQAIFYDVAFGHWIGDKRQPEGFGFIAPALPELVYWANITDDDRRAMLARIIKAANGMWLKKWEPKEDDSGCNYCDVKHVCDKFAIVSQTDAQGRNRASFGRSGATRTARTEKKTRLVVEDQ